jgi:biopolymer transport protein ExbB
MFRTTRFLIIVSMLMLPTISHAKWNEAWTSRSKIAINAPGVGAAVVQVPIAVRLHSGNFNFAEAKPDGSDLRVVAADDKTELKFHIEKFDFVNELAIIWVQLPKVDPADKTAHFWVYYGNEQAVTAGDSKGTWDSNTVAAFHFNAKNLLQDASASGLAATGNITVQKAALLGEAAIFSGQPISVAAAPALRLVAGGGFTYSAWIKPGALPQQATLYRQGGLAIKIDGQKLELISGKTVVSGGEIKTAIWQHVAATVGAGKATLYVNGVPVGTAEMALADTQAEVKTGEGYIGEMDELELANAARSEDWIKLAVQGQGVDSQLLKVEKEAAEGGEGSTSYFGVLFRSLTTDAWVVIIILSIMFTISVAVMVTKTMLIIRTDKGNRHFIEYFHNASDNLLDLEQSASHPDSTLFRLYLAGLREIRKRYSKDNELALSGASMDAIKAAIDADLIRETQKLNAKMVLLTIAISGGPFLGLLGTVVGVMITFAAIAAAGDVNVNAIAPGIAAALLATVAGLGVAIPSLFGYNYLASRIKNITVDMQIFVDEFVTRAAELYGG